MNRTLTLATLAAIALAPAPRVVAEALPLDVLSVTPIGSWQLRETTTTDDKGKQHVAVVRTSLLSEEERDGQPCFWIETEVATYELKKGKRKKKGDDVIVKALVRRSLLTSDPANIVNNLQGFGEEMIMQTGDKEPMKMSGSGSLAQGMMKSLGTKVKFEFTPAGSETVETLAGKFDCTKLNGTGEVEMKVLIKTVKVESESQMWLSDSVPFGLVRSIENTKVNGKPQTSESVLLDMGKAGATSKITKEPTEMPSLGGMFGK